MKGAAQSAATWSAMVIELLGSGRLDEGPPAQAATTATPRSPSRRPWPSLDEGPPRSGAATGACGSLHRAARCLDEGHPLRGGDSVGSSLAAGSIASMKGRPLRAATRGRCDARVDPVGPASMKGRPLRSGDQGGHLPACVAIDGLDEGPPAQGRRRPGRRRWPGRVTSSLDEGPPAQEAATPASCSGADGIATASMKGRPLRGGDVLGSQADQCMVSTEPR